MIAFQFTLAIVLMSSTFLIYKQLNYIFHKDLGFNKEDIVHVPLKRKMGENYALMKQKLLTNPNVEQITNGSPILSSGVEFRDGPGTVSIKKTSIPLPAFRLIATLLSG